jgi:hypothetical protein
MRPCAEWSAKWGVCKKNESRRGELKHGRGIRWIWETQGIRGCWEARIRGTQSIETRPIPEHSFLRDREDKRVGWLGETSDWIAITTILWGAIEAKWIIKYEVTSLLLPIMENLQFKSADDLRTDLANLLSRNRKNPLTYNGNFNPRLGEMPSP